MFPEDSREPEPRPPVDVEARVDRLLRLQGELDALEPSGPQPPAWLMTALRRLNAAVALFFIAIGFVFFGVNRGGGLVFILFGGFLGFMWLVQAARDDRIEERKARIEAEIEALLAEGDGQAADPDPP